MNTKSCILAVFISLLSISSFAQVEADIHRPSINAEQFGFALKAEAALNKGQLSVNIPLMTLKGKGYDLPISLTFYSGDVTTTTEASPIGLGWALMAGGVVAVTIKGRDDIEDYSEDWKTDHHTDIDYIEKNYRDPLGRFLDRIQWNSMPDEYSYSLPGHSGTIELSVENKTIKKTLFPDESYKIEQTKNGYCITADDGTKFYFEDAEQRIGGAASQSTSYFLSRIETTKGGYFKFTYAREDYLDLSAIRDVEDNFYLYHTKRITRIESDFGYVTFNAVNRDDRGGYRYVTIANDKRSKRINKIELRDKEGNLIKGCELDNSRLFRLKDYTWEDPSDDWYNCRLKLSSITQYDSVGNRLPPYKFTYDYQFSKSRLQYSFLSNTDSDGNYIPYDSWTSETGSQSYVDLHTTGAPRCWIGEGPNSYPTGYSSSSVAGNNETTKDYFCLDRINYPTGAIDQFYYEPHCYTKINATEASPEFLTQIQGQRLATKIRKPDDKSIYSQRTDYIYKLHDENYNASGPSSGVLTNPSIHNATYYTPEISNGGPYSDSGSLYLRASRISSGKPFNSFMGTPVCYTEVEEVEFDEYVDTLSRTIHYYEPQIVAPPVNYFLMHSPREEPDLVKIENIIYGTKSGYSFGMESANNVPHTYMAYPVGEFCNTAYVVDKPLKEVFIGKDHKIRSKKEYIYSIGDYDKCKKYGYKLVHPNNTDYTLISKSEYISHQNRLKEISTTTYYYDGEKCDSVCEKCVMHYNKGRTNWISNSRGGKDYGEGTFSEYFYPDDVKINNMAENNADSTLAAINMLKDKNIIANPIKTIVMHNGVTNGGECKNYQMVSGRPLLKSLYKVKNTNKVSYNPPTMDSDTINYLVDLYKEGVILTYDADLNPEHIKLNDTQDRIYVWGYGGRFPIAVIDNMDGNTFQSLNLKAKILQLQSYRKIETEDKCASLRSLNASIRSMLPESAHITTYTYDPYFGMTSETDDSNLGTIYTYDTFGRLTAKYDENYKKLEEYNYHYKLQQ